VVSRWASLSPLASSPMKKTISHRGTPFSISKADLEKLAAQEPQRSLVDLIFARVGGGIQSRQLAVGARLPSVRQLADDCVISRDTAARAYDKLVAHGLVESRPGSGFYVKATTRHLPPPTTPAVFQGPARSGDTRWRIRLLRTDAPLRSRTGSGVLPEDWLDEDALNGALRAVARSSQRSLAHHGDPKGYLPLRQQLQLKLQEVGIQVDAGQILITGGATDALHLIMQAFVRTAREYVLVEDPHPHLLTDRMLSTGLEILPVPRLADGPDLVSLRALCEKHQPRFFFCSSVLHNPTSMQMAPHKAFQLLQLAEEFDLTLVEDDTYGDLMPPSYSTAVARLAPLDQLKRVIYVGSFSKTLAPGLRCGFLAASPDRIEWLTTYRIVGGIAGTNLSERVVYRLLSQGSYRHHCDQLRARLDERRPRAVESLRDLGMRVDHVPDAGMYLWASLADASMDAMQVAERLLEQGHLLAPGHLFSTHPRYRSFLRLNIAELTGSPMLPALAQLLGR
jgi:DNA-binding transcriptional MocR family regulator